MQNDELIFYSDKTKNTVDAKASASIFNAG